MSQRIAGTFLIPGAGPKAWIEVEPVEPSATPRWRLRVALWLIRLAGRVARMRVRIAR